LGVHHIWINTDNQDDSTIQIVRSAFHHPSIFRRQDSTIRAPRTGFHHLNSTILFPALGSHHQDPNIVLCVSPSIRITKYGLQHQDQAVKFISTIENLPLGFYHVMVRSCGCANGMGDIDIGIQIGKAPSVLAEKYKQPPLDVAKRISSLSCSS
jgi:hypothetical protein